MGRDVSIAISVKDNFSSAITTIRNSNQAFNKDLTGTMEKLDALNKNKITLKVDTEKAKSELKEAEKQFAKTGSAADKMALELANGNYENARRNLDLVSKNARQAEKDILSMTDAVEKSDNRASRVSSGSNPDKEILSRLGGAGLGKMLGDSLSSAANVLATSKFGSEGGNIFGSILSGITTGAAMGSMAGHTIIGAGIGAVSGAVSAATKTFENQDNAFKDTAQTTYDNVIQNRKDILATGSDIAAQRETDKLSFTTMLGGSKNADKFLSETIDFAGRTPFEYDDLTKISKTMLAYGYKQDEIFSQLTKVGDTGSATGMSMEDMNYVVTALGRMKSTGKTTMEYLNMLLERHIPALDYLAEASGRTKGQIVEMVSKGLIPGAEAAKIISDYMGKANKGSMELQSKSYAGLQSSLDDAQKNVYGVMGDAHNEEAKKGIQERIDWLEKSSNKMKEAYSLYGKWKGSQENKEALMKNDAWDSVTSGKITGDFTDEGKHQLTELAKQYQQLEKDAKAGNEKAGAEAGEVLAKAEALAINEYKATTGYQLQLQSDLNLASSIRNSTELRKEYYDTGKKMGEELSRGLVDAYLANVEKGLHPRIGMAGIPNNHKSSGLSGMVEAPNNHKPSGYFGMAGIGSATGINRVPYNNFPALLHEGEKVSTAVEARSQKGGGVKVEINGPVTVRQESDIDAIASALARKLQQAELVTP